MGFDLGGMFCYWCLVMRSAPFHFVSSDAYATSWISFFHGLNVYLVGGVGLVLMKGIFLFSL